MTLLEMIAVMPHVSGSFPCDQGWLFNARTLGMSGGVNPFVPLGFMDELSPPFIIDGPPNPMYCNKVTAMDDICLALGPVPPVCVPAVEVLPTEVPRGPVTLERRR